MNLHTVQNPGFASTSSLRRPDLHYQKHRRALDPAQRRERQVISTFNLVPSVGLYPQTFPDQAQNSRTCNPVRERLHSLCAQRYRKSYGCLRRAPEPLPVIVEGSPSLLFIFTLIPKFRSKIRKPLARYLTHQDRSHRKGTVSRLGYSFVFFRFVRNIYGMDR